MFSSIDSTLERLLDHELLITLGERLGLDAPRLPDTARARLALFAALGPVLCSRQQHLRLRAAEAAPELQALWRRLADAHLEPWRLHTHDGAPHGHRAAGPRPDGSHTLQETLEPTAHIGESLARFYIGFPLPDPRQPTAFIAIAPLDAAGLRRVERLAALAEILDDGAGTAPWRDHQDELLRIALDPHNRFALPGALAPPSVVGDVPDIDALTHAILSHINDAVHNASPWTSRRRTFRRTRWARVTIARAQQPHDLASLRRAIARLRFHLLSYNERLFLQAFEEDDPNLERLLPTDRVLEALGCRPDASVIGAEPETLAREPIALLGLPDDHPLFLHHHAREPIHFARTFARREGMDDVEEAFQTLALERRWIRTFEHLDLDDEDALEAIPYDAITHGLHELFHPDLFLTPLDQIGLDARDARRLLDALGERAALARLPERQAQILAIPGLGPTTLLKLKAALITLARTWRAHRAGVQPRRPATTRDTQPDESRGAIADGLDELAALFGDLE